MDRAALPKGVTFGPAVVPTVSIDGDSPRGRDGYLEADAEMHGDEREAEDPAGSYRDDGDAVGGDPSTPVWPPADATLAQLEDWLDSFRRLPEDEGILARQDLLSRSIRELRMPMPALPAPPLTFVLRAKRATDKRRRQLHRFIAMRDDFLAQERALQASIVDAHAMITATQRFLTLAEDEEYERFRSCASSLDAPGRVASPDAARAASADAARQAGHDPDAADAAVGVSGIIAQLLTLPTVAEASNLESAYAAVLEQARLVHHAFTGDRGPTLAPVPPTPWRVPGGGGGVAPPMAWVPGSAGPDPSALRRCPCPPLSLLRPLPQLPSAPRGFLSPMAHGGYAGVVSGGPAPTPAESAGHEARVRSASRSLERPRPLAASPAAGSRAEERGRSPRGQSALAAALAAEVAEAEAERHASTDAYMPVAGADSPEDDDGPPSASHSSHSAHSAGFGTPGSVGELRIQVATTAALLRMAIEAGPSSGVGAARADAADAEAALAAAMARPGDHPVRPLPQSLRPIYKAPPPEAYLPRAAGPPQLADGAAAAALGPAEVSAPGWGWRWRPRRPWQRFCEPWGCRCHPCGGFRACSCRPPAFIGRQGWHGGRGRGSPGFHRIGILPSRRGEHPRRARSCHPGFFRGRRSCRLRLSKGSRGERCCCRCTGCLGSRCGGGHRRCACLRRHTYASRASRRPLPRLRLRAPGCAPAKSRPGDGFVF